ncbi:MAG TPA: hypothetical protein VGJ20_09650 [Xanthobacteraceae bacterium]|jgi:hypothetical protein
MNSINKTACDYVKQEGAASNEAPDTAALKGMLKSGVPLRQAEAILKYFAAVKAGRMALEPAVANMLGRPARRFDEWIVTNTAALHA